MSRNLRIPSLCYHKSRDLHYVSLNGRTVYLARELETAQAQYDRLIGEWIANGRHLPTTLAGEAPADLTVNELVVAFLRWGDEYYRRPDGSPTKEPENLRLAMRQLCRLYGETPAARFGPLALRSVREAWIAEGLCRAEVNRRASRLRRLFKWGAGRELVTVTVHQSLQAVEPLKLGRTGAREAAPVGAVPLAFIEEILPFLGRQVAAMVRLQLLTGSRPGEIAMMRTVDLDTTGAVWFFNPPTHKMSYRGRPRRIALGPQAQEILREWLRPELEAFLFQPREADEERRAAQRVTRKSKVQPSQRDRRKAAPKKKPGEQYDTASYRRAIHYAIQRANQERAKRKEAPMPVWSPHAIRHLRATQLQREFGWEVARATLGHAGVDCTAIYVERDERLASEAALRVG